MQAGPLKYIRQFIFDNVEPNRIAIRRRRQLSHQPTPKCMPQMSRQGRGGCQSLGQSYSRRCSASTSVIFQRLRSPSKVGKTCSPKSNQRLAQ